MWYLNKKIYLIIILIAIVCNGKNLLEVYNNIFPVVERYILVSSWGGKGSGDGQFRTINGIAVSAEGYIYLSDYYNHRIQKFDTQGNFLKKWGNYGSRDGEFKYPGVLAVDADENIYVADQANYRIQKFDSDGNFINKWNIRGRGIVQGITVTADRYILATVAGCTIQKFTVDGELIERWIVPTSNYSALSDITVDKLGDIYVVSSDLTVKDGYSSYIYKFNSSGKHNSAWRIKKTESKFFDDEIEIIANSEGNIFVITCSSNVVYEFDLSGNFIEKWKIKGKGGRQLDKPGKIALDSNGNIYVADPEKCQIQKFAPNPNFK